jgi:hypothetical protein
MRKVFATSITVLAATALGIAPAVLAQTKSPEPMKAPTQMNHKVEGKIKRVDPNGSHVTLEDGTTLMIPASVGVTKEQLKPGALIVAEYQEKDGQKVATSIAIKG